MSQITTPVPRSPASSPPTKSTGKPNVTEYLVLGEDGTVKRGRSFAITDDDARSEFVHAAIGGGWRGTCMVAVPKFERDVWYGFNLQEMLLSGLPPRSPSKSLRMWFRDDGMYDPSLRPNTQASAAVVAKWLLDGHPLGWVRAQAMIVGPCVIEVPSVWTRVVAKGMAEETCGEALSGLQGLDDPDIIRGYIGNTYRFLTRSPEMAAMIAMALRLPK